MSSTTALPDDWIEAGTEFVDLEKYIQQRSKRLSSGITGWLHDFNLLNKATTYSKSSLKAAGGFHTALSSPNRDKNRYSDEYSRVILPLLPNKPRSDYINANFISDPKLNIPGFIASQGPVKHTVFDFWRLIWTYHTPIVIMLTGLEESGRNKCYQYWPAPHNVDQDSKKQFGSKKTVLYNKICTSYGNFHVQLLKADLVDERGIVRRTMRITRYPNSSQAHCSHCQSHPKNAPQKTSNAVSFKSETFSTMDDILRMAEEEAETETDPSHSSLFTPVTLSSEYVSESDSELVDTTGTPSPLSSTIPSSSPTLPSESRTITQFHFIAWPDHGVPSSPEILLSLVKIVRNFEQKLLNNEGYMNSLTSWTSRISKSIAKASRSADDYFISLIQSKSPKSSRKSPKFKLKMPKKAASLLANNNNPDIKPRITPQFGLSLVHCSAGVGRTGTFMATYILQQQINDYLLHRQKQYQLAALHPISPRILPMKFNPYSVVKQLREYRAFLVYTVEQYQLVHTASFHSAKTAKILISRVSYEDMFTTPGR